MKLDMCIPYDPRHLTFWFVPKNSEQIFAPKSLCIWSTVNHLCQTVKLSSVKKNSLNHLLKYMVKTNLYSTNAISKTEYPYLFYSPYDLTQVLRAKNNSLKVVNNTDSELNKSSDRESGRRPSPLAKRRLA